jgi:hypothetical protein
MKNPDPDAVHEFSGNCFVFESIAKSGPAKKGLERSPVPVDGLIHDPFGYAHGPAAQAMRGGFSRNP